MTDVLRGEQFVVNSLIQPEMFDVVTALCERDYRILHIAAHGEYNRDGRTGVVMSRKRLLTALELGQMRIMPDLAFLNCCHLGRIDPKQDERRMQDMNKLAASVAEELIRDGVRCGCGGGLGGRRFGRSGIRPQTVRRVAGGRELRRGGIQSA